MGVTFRRQCWMDGVPLFLPSKFTSAHFPLRFNCYFTFRLCSFPLNKSPILLLVNCLKHNSFTSSSCLKSLSDTLCLQKKFQASWLTLILVDSEVRKSLGLLLETSRTVVEVSLASHSGFSHGAHVSSLELGRPWSREACGWFVRSRAGTAFIHSKEVHTLMGTEDYSGSWHPLPCTE